MPGDLQFFIHVEIGAGSLLPVPQGRIEDKDFMCHVKTFLFPAGVCSYRPCGWAICPVLLVIS